MTGDIDTLGRASLPTPKSTRAFWHSEPSAVLLHHRTTPSVPTKADVVIVGSGICGASAAFHLRESFPNKNRNVVMLEAREACWGATGRNGGHCQPMIYYKEPEIGAFELRNYQAIKSLIEKNNIPCEWESVPGCHAFLTSSMFEEAVESVKSLQKASPDLARLVAVVTTESEKPSLKDLRVPGAKGAILQGNAAKLWPYKFVAWILESLLQSGDLNLQTNTPATHLQKVDDGWIVHTPRGMIYTPTVLLTTNGYTSHLVPGFSDLIVPVRGEMSALVAPAAVRPGVVSKPLQCSYGFMGNANQTINQDDYLIQREFSEVDGSGGQLMFGGGRSYAAHAGVGVSDDSHIDPPAASYLRRELNNLLDLNNDEEELQAQWEWSGIMGYSRDGRPWVGELREECGVGGGKGLWISGGFTGHGMPNTWLCGKAVVELIMGRDGGVDLPSTYRLSEERIVKARTYDEVSVADSRI